MKIKRFIAPDMRQAINAVRETLGPDAVILSNKTVEGGVELTAAVDFDESALMARSEPAPAPRAEVREARPGSEPTSARPRGTQPRSERPAPRSQPVREESPVAEAAEARASVTPLQQRSRPVREERAAEPRYSARPGMTRIFDEQDDLLQEMRREMQAMRRMMEEELSELTWRDTARRRPELRELMRRLLNMGLGQELARSLMERVEDEESLELAWRKALYFLGIELQVTGDDLTEQGGVVAVIGPTGVGKTTTIAKLAARFCMRHGNRHVALITTDNYRIGAQEQLHTYGRILNVPVRTAANAEELADALNGLLDKRLVLIDTAGMSQRDVRLDEQLAVLSAGPHAVRRLLTLSATTEQHALSHAVKAFSGVRPDGCLLTKVDEAAALGGALSVIIESGLPLAYYTDGQQVPEDLHVARAHQLINRAAGLAQEMESLDNPNPSAPHREDFETHAQYS